MEVEHACATLHVEVVRKLLRAILKAINNTMTDEDLRNPKLKLSLENQDLKHLRNMAGILLVDLD